MNKKFIQAESTNAKYLLNFSRIYIYFSFLSVKKNWYVNNQFIFSVELRLKPKSIFNFNF